MKKWLWVLSVLMVLTLNSSWTGRAQEGISLHSWIELAFEKNPDFQLQLADHRLALQQMEFSERPGIKSANLSLSPIILGTQGIVHNYGVGVQYSGSLSRKIQFSGSNSLATDAQGKPQLSGSIQVGFDPRILWERDKESVAGVAYLDATNRWLEVRMSLATTVVNRYTSLLRLQLQEEVLQRKQELAKFHLTKAQREFEAGLISMLDLYAAEDACQLAVKSSAQLKRSAEKALQEFFQLYGNEQHDPFRVEVLEIHLPLPQVETLLQEWDSIRVEDLIQGLYAYEKARIALIQAEEAVEEARARDDWKFQFSASLNYATTGKPNVQGTVGLGKELYNPGTKMDLHQTEIQLERQRLAFTEKQNQLIAQVESQGSVVMEARADLSEGQEELQLANERYLRICKQVEHGFLTQQDLIQAEVFLLEKKVALLQTVENEIKARLVLAQILGLDEFAQAD